ncbi:unnamed protein product [Caenorhabditis sp. 36 PRJEB53466]|nr:unnamed protein product [Caenorhabditis sp. 36 PRJEB53466]
MNRARKTSSCGCFRSAFCVLKPSTSSGHHADTEKKLLSARTSAARDDEPTSPPSRPLKIPPLDLNGVEANEKRHVTQVVLDGLQRPRSLLRKQKDGTDTGATSSGGSPQRNKSFDNSAALESIEK